MKGGYDGSMDSDKNKRVVNLKRIVVNSPIKVGYQDERCLSCFLLALVKNFILYSLHKALAIPVMVSQLI